jgi:predicted GH43/DUF377 family glycosyl hydrolase
MMFHWKKLGQVFNPTLYSDNSWMIEQAQNPFVLIFDDFIRVYFNTRPKRDELGKSKSLPGYVDIDKENLLNVLRVASKPILDFGKVGTFDEFGVMAGSVVKIGEEYFIYYCGWTRKFSVPYDWAIGLAKSVDGESYERIGEGPILGATLKEPYLQAGCSSIFMERGIYHLFYTSGINWINTSDKQESVYQIMHATSSDAINWNRDGKLIIQSIIDDEAQASPTIIRIGEKWHMFFSYRHTVDFRNKERGYKIGYAYSNDLINWTRVDEIGNFSVSESGWDSEMVCYPHIFQLEGKIYMLYCGNDFGREGFGVAELIY